MTPEQVEAQRPVFESFIRTHVEFYPKRLDRYAGEPKVGTPNGEYVKLTVQSMWETWLAAKSQQVEITEEMAIRGAWGPINEGLKGRGVEPFDLGASPSKPEIERARLVLSAALNGGTP